MSTEHVAVGVIDVYTDTVPTPRQRARAASDPPRTQLQMGPTTSGRLRWRHP